jgi:predicted AAA+ superfamily ATPase
MTGYIERDLAKSVAAALADMPVVVVTGPRQSGKSTFLERDPIFRGRRYVTLDDLGSLAAARTDPEGFTDTDEPITIDEVQRCPELLIAVKRSVDRDRRPGRFVEAVEKLASESFRADRGPKARARRRRRRSFTHSGRRSLSAPFLYL